MRPLGKTERFDVEHVVRNFSMFRSPVETAPFYYLDNAAMTQTPDCVIEAMYKHERGWRANIKRGLYGPAEEATQAYEDARQTVARFLGTSDPHEVVFTSGATSSINMLALILGYGMRPGDEVLLSLLEHHSNIVPWQLLSDRTGVILKFLPVKEDGCLDLARLGAFINERTKLVALTHGSNVSAAITEVAAIVQCAHQHGAKVMLDGAQMAPHGPIDLDALDVDFYVFSSHKVYGPTGVGVLWGRRECLQEMQPAFGGGEMIDAVTLQKSSYASVPHRFEAGTPPVTQVIGLGVALDWLMHQDISGMKKHLSGLAERIIAGLATIDKKSGLINIFGPALGKERLPLVSFSIDGAHPHDICQMMSDRHGVALRGGHHCAQPLHDHWGIQGSTRVSLAIYNRVNDVDAFLNGIEDCIGLFC
ncbi:MAG: cysteine desulfurase [Deltaproteobacteria bacterium HGW-Deltaproteobacteria-12]|jgi:cysteine desulfurase/selenocysteine lyase|nr:MAG: cysteine desulfurase [Deltaproteobacteria bacterium HGW-Deltaproteobacteria-12]